MKTLQKWKTDSEGLGKSYLSKSPALLTSLAIDFEAVFADDALLDDRYWGKWAGLGEETETLPTVFPETWSRSASQNSSLNLWSRLQHNF